MLETWVLVVLMCSANMPQRPCLQHTQEFTETRQSLAAKPFCLAAAEGFMKANDGTKAWCYDKRYGTVFIPSGSLFGKQP